MQGNIYCITNLSNNKKYIGKTLFNIQKRFQQHIKESRKSNTIGRPLHQAIHKYGVEQFELILIESVPIEQLNSRERYWIDYYDTHKHGYNATIGGDGKILYDYDEIIQLYNKGMLQSEIAEELGCHRHTVRNVLNLAKIDSTINRVNNRKISVNQLSLDGKLINTFDSFIEAALWLIQEKNLKSKPSSISTNISRCCYGIRKTCYQFKWELNN